MMAEVAPVSGIVLQPPRQYCIDASVEAWPQMEQQLRKAVFLDRDDTIAKDVPYCSRVEDFEILPSVPEGIRLLNEHGFIVVVITNQSGIARGYFTEQTLSQIHEKLHRELGRWNAHVDAIYHCPHHPDDGCECRKPKPTLLLQAAKDMGIDLHLSYMVGDDVKDIDSGRSAGCKTVLVTTGPDRGSLEGQEVSPDYVAHSLCEAAEWIVRDALLGRYEPQ